MSTDRVSLRALVVSVTGLLGAALVCVSLQGVNHAWMAYRKADSIVGLGTVSRLLFSEMSHIRKARGMMASALLADLPAEVGTSSAVLRSVDAALSDTARMVDAIRKTGVPDIDGDLKRIAEDMSSVASVRDAMIRTLSVSRTARDRNDVALIDEVFAETLDSYRAAMRKVAAMLSRSDHGVEAYIVVWGDTLKAVDCDESVLTRIVRSDVGNVSWTPMDVMSAYQDRGRATEAWSRVLDASESPVIARDLSDEIKRVSGSYLGFRDGFFRMDMSRLSYGQKPADDTMQLLRSGEVVLSAMDGLSMLAMADMIETVKDDRQATLHALYSALGYCAISFVLAVAGILVAIRYISNPLTRIAKLMSEMSERYLQSSHTLAGQTHNMGRMEDALRMFDTKIAASECAEAAVSSERARLEQERVRLHAEQSVVVRELKEGLANLASGNLTYAIEGPFSSDYESVRLDFNAAMEILRTTREHAMRDPLTGLFNRNGLMHKRRAQDNTMAVFCLDLDGFKSVNDTMGHATGDLLLKAVAARLRTSIRDGDFVARMGGDEFVVVAYDLCEVDAVEMGTRLVDAVKGEDYALGCGRTVQIGASCGLACAPMDAGDFDGLMLAADAALYQAKADGKGVCRRAPPKGLSAAA